MNLQLHLLSRITLVALLCLLATTAYVMQRSDKQSRQATKITADAMVKQLEFQLLRINAGYQPVNPFPDFDVWKQTSHVPGVCLRFVSAEPNPVRSLCHGAQTYDQSWPAVFETLYRRMFAPGAELTQPVAFNGRVYGTLTVASSAEMAIAQAWGNVLGLLELSGITILTVCLLVYLIVSRALRPARAIVAGLERMQQGDLSYRLPDFALLEWRHTAIAINQLAANQQQLLVERQTLLAKLMTLQEEERRYLAREMHDEFGQCLAAINAIVAAIAQTARQQCPELISETNQLFRFSGHMMDSVRGLLQRLRPAELDELGLAASLGSLVAGWRGRGGGKICYRLSITGDCSSLPETLTITLFRVVQECLTNIAKHSAAENADVILNVAKDGVVLTIRDDGNAALLPFVDSPGIGLLGIRERIVALDGRLVLSINKPHGLVVDAWLPLQPPTEAAT